MGRAEEIRARAKRYSERAEAMRGQHVSVDAVYVIADRDSELGGGLMAGALAYRIFIWLLPFALVIVAGIGIAASASESPESASSSLGLHGVVASSVAQAAHGSSRWYALLIGVPVLLWATRNLLKTLVVVHRLVWSEPRRTVRKPSVSATLWFLLLLVAFFALNQLARSVGSWTGSVTLRILVGFVAIGGWWLVISMRLPHRGVPWLELVPGAILMAVGLELLSSIGVFLIAPRIESSQRAYGALGLAATLLFGLYLVSRLVVASAVVNATVSEKRSAQ